MDRYFSAVCVLSGAEVGDDGVGDEVAVSGAEFAFTVDVFAFVLSAGNDDFGKLKARLGRSLTFWMVVSSRVTPLTESLVGSVMA